MKLLMSSQKTDLQFSAVFNLTTVLQLPWTDRTVWMQEEEEWEFCRIAGFHSVTKFGSPQVETAHLQSRGSPPMGVPRSWRLETCVYFFNRILFRFLAGSKQSRLF